jgi:hypothetical protein
MVSNPAPGLRHPVPQARPAVPEPRDASSAHAVLEPQDAGPARAVPEPRDAGSPRAVPEPWNARSPGTPAEPGPRAYGLAHAPTAGTQAAPTIPANLLPNRTPAQLLAIARQGLGEAARTRPDGLRYAAAHLAALRAAAAVLAARARPAAPTRRNRVTSTWSLLVLVAPEFGDWASYFALGAAKRAAAEAGIPRVVTAREADDLLTAAETFVSLVQAALGLAYQPTFEAA